MPVRSPALPAALLTLAMMMPTGVAAQENPVPHLPWGAPDLQGVWDFRSLTPMERPDEIAEQEEFTAEESAAFSADSIRRRSRDSSTSDRAARVAQGDIIPYNDFWFDEGTTVTTTRTSLVIDPPDGRIPPLTPEAERAQAARREARRSVGPDEPPIGGWVEDLGDNPRCTRGFNAGPPMRPSAYNNNMQLLQAPDYVVILNEMIHDARIVPLDGRPRLAEDMRLWAGSSRGRWEGETLVVETTHVRARAFRGSTDSLQVIERFTRTDHDTLAYEVTVEDPATWTRPWTFLVPMARSDAGLYEYACHEGNYGLYNILAAAGIRDAALRGAR